MGGSRLLDWSNLPSELIHLISKNLHDISDFIRFRAVCKTWQSSASVYDTPPQIPWFLERRDILDSNLRFYSLFSGEIHTVSCSNSSGRWLKGPAHDYVLAYHSLTHSLSLLNPITNNEIPLPFLDITGPHPVKIDPNPIRNGKSLVLSGNSADFRTGMLAFYQQDERKWVVIEEEWSFHYHDAFSNGLFYANEVETSTTKAIDVNTKSIKYIVPPPVNSEDERTSVYLIESSGKILRVSQLDNELVPIQDCHFHIHQLELAENGKSCWIKIDSIGDRILFLDLDNGFSLSASDFKGYKGNSIYFLKFQSQDIYEPPHCLLCRYDIEEGRTEALDCPFPNGGTWIVPSLR